MATGSASDTVAAATIINIEKDRSNSNDSDPAVVAEKGEMFIVEEEPEEDDDGNFLYSHEEQFPIDPNAEVEEQQFTIRAVFVGCCLGGVIAASNVYLGLKVRPISARL